MKNLTYCSLGCLLMLFSTAGLLSAQGGASNYTALCASCHEGGNDRAPNRAALGVMSPERVLAAMESGAMVSMASGRSTGDRRAIAEFVSGKSF
ncbi:MAG TPA: cytochrome c, partial [Terriglobia bacterium]|nr:cytochrome c [Terriglobia bacterium]